MKRYIVVQASNAYSDYPEIELEGDYDDWLDAVAAARREGIIIIDTYTGKAWEEEGDKVQQTKKDFAWYMNKDEEVRPPYRGHKDNPGWLYYE